VAGRWVGARHIFEGECGGVGSEEGGLHEFHGEPTGPPPVNFAQSIESMDVRSGPTLCGHRKVLKIQTCILQGLEGKGKGSSRSLLFMI
jgi:hypothetical protein